MNVHALQRISPKGGPFIGQCIKCGRTGLTLAQMMDDCPNYRGLSCAETVAEAIRGSA